MPRPQSEVPGPEVWWRGSQKSNKPSKPPTIYENSKKTEGFAHVLANKSQKMLFFAQKYLTRYTHKTFFEEYMNFETHYLSHCRIIPLQSFRSHIRPQPHGLGLNISLCVYKLTSFSNNSNLVTYVDLFIGKIITCINFRRCIWDINEKCNPYK